MSVKLNGLEFIDNSNNCAENLFGDGLHLNDDSRVILANILARETKNFAVALVRIIFYVKQLSITTMKSLPISQIVLK